VQNNAAFADGKKFDFSGGYVWLQVSFFNKSYSFYIWLWCWWNKAHSLLIIKRHQHKDFIQHVNFLLMIIYFIWC